MAQGDATPWRAGACGQCGEEKDVREVADVEGLVCGDCRPDDATEPLTAEATAGDEDAPVEALKDMLRGLARQRRWLVVILILIPIITIVALPLPEKLGWAVLSLTGALSIWAIVLVWQVARIIRIGAGITVVVSILLLIPLINLGVLVLVIKQLNKFILLAGWELDHRDDEPDEAEVEPS